jgi:hypothetical protein
MCYNVCDKVNCVKGGHKASPMRRTKTNDIFSILTVWFAWRFTADHQMKTETRAILNARHDAERKSST